MAEASKDHPFPNTAGILASDQRAKFEQFETGTWKGKNRQLIPGKKWLQDPYSGNLGQPWQSAVMGGDEEEGKTSLGGRKQVCLQEGRTVLDEAGTFLFQFPDLYYLSRLCRSQSWGEIQLLCL